MVDIFFIYVTSSVLLDYRYGGTVGKMALGLSVTTITNHKLSLFTSLYRNLGKVIFGIFLAESLLIVFTIRRSGIHNRLARCKVIEIPAPAPG